MSVFAKLPYLTIIAIFLMLPVTGNCMDIHKEVIPLVQMLQSGKAKISPDKKSIIDENGHIVGKETDKVSVPKAQPAANPPDSGKENAPPAPQLFLCTKKCAMISKHCYADENENIVCINECDRESLICE